MSITYEQAVELLHEWTPSPALRNHARAVEAAMRKSAHRYGAGEADELRWALTGLLHDADYDQWPDEHPRRIVDWLEDQGEPEIAHAVSVHFTNWGIEPVSMLDKALLACDELDRVRHGLQPGAARGDPHAEPFERQEEAEGQELRGQGRSSGRLLRGRAAGRGPRGAHPARDRRPDPARRVAGDLGVGPAGRRGLVSERIGIRFTQAEAQRR